MEEGELLVSASTRSFVTARVNEVIALSKEIQHQKGLEAKGLAFQHVPKHMRRRAVSHNPKRLPKRLQALHWSQSKKSGGGSKKPKRPRNRYRPRKTNLVAEYNRRQNTVKWMETHVWHAKRFHMTKKWGYKIPVQPTDKSYRAIYRGFTTYSTVQDISYYSCLQLRGDFTVISEKMKEIIPPPANLLSLHAVYYSEYLREGTAHIYQRGSYPLGYIGPVSFFWNASTDLLWIWVHPSFKSEVIQEMSSLFNLEEVFTESRTQSAVPGSVLDEESVPSSERVKIDSRKLEAKNLTQPPMWINGSTKIELTDLEGALNRFRLVGPETTAILQNLLNVQQQLSDSGPERNTALNLRTSYEARYGQKPLLWDTQAQIWNGSRNYNDFPSNTILPLTVRDPRVFPVQVRSKLESKENNRSEEEDTDLENFQTQLLEHRKLNESPLWDTKLRNSILMEKMSESDLAKERGKVLLSGLEVNLEERENQVPIILIQKPEQLGGWDLIIPAGWAMPFWIGLSFRCVRAFGHRDILHYTFSSITSNEDPDDSFLKNSLSANLFPPDSISGQQEQNFLQQTAKEVYFRLPPDKRNHFLQLACPYPFHIDWGKFLYFWQNLRSDENASHFTDFTNQSLSSEILVLRDHHLLKSLQDGLSPEGLRDNVGLSILHQTIDACLIPIYVTCVGRGKPVSNAILCLPTVADLEKLLQPSVSNHKDSIYHQEPDPDKKQMSEIEAMKTELRQKHRKKLALLRRKRKRAIEACNKMQIKFDRTQSKYNSAELCADYNSKMNSMFIPEDPLAILSQMSRVPIGFITFGGESYKIGKGAGIGYISMGGYQRLASVYHEYYNHLINQNVPSNEALDRMRSFVLMRDAKTSMTYRIAQLHIC